MSQVNHLSTVALDKRMSMRIFHLFTAHQVKSPTVKEIVMFKIIKKLCILNLEVEMSEE